MELVVEIVAAKMSCQCGAICYKTDIRLPAKNYRIVTTLPANFHDFPFRGPLLGSNFERK